MLEKMPQVENVRNQGLEEKTWMWRVALIKATQINDRGKREEGV